MLINWVSSINLIVTFHNFYVAIVLIYYCSKEEEYRVCQRIEKQLFD